MGETFHYAVGVGPPVALVALLAAGFIYKTQKRRRLSRYDRYDEKDEGVTEPLA